MNKAAAKSIFTCKRDVDAFLGMYLTERQTHGAGASQPSASAHEPSAKTSQPQRLAPPAGAILSEHDGDEFNASLPSFGAGRVVPEDGDDAWYSRRDGRRVLARYMSQDDIFAKSRQALLGTDGAASQPANPKAKPMPTNTAVSPQATDGGASQTANPRAEPMPTDRSAGASDRWAAAWVTRAIAAEWSRLRPFQFQSLLQTADTREVSHTGTWAHFVNKLERCVAAHTRQELGVANVEHSRRFSACDALQTATTAVVSLLYKLQFRSPELIDEFKSLVERLVVNTSRFVAADVVLQRLLSSGFTSSDEQRRKQIVSAIAAEMEKHVLLQEDNAKSYARGWSPWIAAE